MKFTKTTLPGVWRIDPVVYEDGRGFFMEAHSRRVFAEHGVDVEFTQTNHSHSVRNTLRGLHYQVGQPQGKLVRVIRGSVFDVVVDMRRDSAAFGKIFTIELSESNRIMLYLPPGFAHGFCVLSDAADFLYACTDYYFPRGERGVIWNDPDLSVPWPVKDPLLSEKDRKLPRFKDIPPADLF